MTKTDEELRIEYAQVLEDQRKNLIRHDDARSLRILRAVAVRLLTLFPAVGPARLVATPETMSLVSPTTLSKIKEKTGQVALDCHWQTSNATRLPDFPWIVEHMQSYSQQMDWHPEACVVFEPIVRERSSVRALLLAASDDHPGVPLHLVTFSAVCGQVETLCAEMETMLGNDGCCPVRVHGFDDLGPSDPRWLAVIRNGPMDCMDRGTRTPEIVVEAMAPALRRIYRIDEDVATA